MHLNKRHDCIYGNRYSPELEDSATGSELPNNNITGILIYIREKPLSLRSTCHVAQANIVCIHTLTHQCVTSVSPAFARHSNSELCKQNRGQQELNGKICLYAGKKVRNNLWPQQTEFCVKAKQNIWFRFGPENNAEDIQNESVNPLAPALPFSPLVVDFWWEKCFLITDPHQERSNPPCTLPASLMENHMTLVYKITYQTNFQEYT